MKSLFVALLLLATPALAAEPALRSSARLLFKQGINDGIATESATIDAASAAIAELQAKADTVTKLTALTKALGGASSQTLNDKPDA